MSYTASALSYMLENLGKTVVLTGAMSPLEAPISDAKRNLIISMFVAANSEIPEVLIFFDSVLLRSVPCALRPLPRACPATPHTTYHATVQRRAEPRANETQRPGGSDAK
jgi:hypothetical protein